MLIFNVVAKLNGSNCKYFYVPVSVEFLFDEDGWMHIYMYQISRTRMYVDSNMFRCWFPGERWCVKQVVTACRLVDSKRNQ